MNWDFTLIAADVAPLLLWLIYRFKRAVKKATKELRRNEAEIVALEMYGLQSQRVIEAFGTQELEESRLRKASRAAVQSSLIPVAPLATSPGLRRFFRRGRQSSALVILACHGVTVHFLVTPPPPTAPGTVHDQRRGHCLRHRRADSVPRSVDSLSNKNSTHFELART